jgi:hypothetical protein
MIKCIGTEKNVCHTTSFILVWTLNPDMPNTFSTYSQTECSNATSAWFCWSQSLHNALGHTIDYLDSDGANFALGANKIKRGKQFIFF